MHELAAAALTHPPRARNFIGSLEIKILFSFSLRRLDFRILAQLSHTEALTKCILNAGTHAPSEMIVR